MNSLDKLLSDISELYEVKRAENLAKYLNNKYSDIFKIDEIENDEIVNEFKDILSELSNLSNVISVTFLNELNLD